MFGKTYFADVINQLIHDIQPNRTKILEDSIKRFIPIPRQDTKLLLLEQPQWIPPTYPLREEHYYCPPSWMNNTHEQRKLLNCNLKNNLLNILLEEETQMQKEEITINGEEKRIIIKENDTFPEHTTKVTLILKYKSMIIEAQYKKENKEWQLDDWEVLANPLHHVLFTQSWLLEDFIPHAYTPRFLAPSCSEILLADVTITQSLREQYDKLVQHYKDKHTSFKEVISKIYDIQFCTFDADFVQVIAMIDSLFCTPCGYKILKESYNNCSTFENGLKDSSTQKLIEDE